MKELCDSLRLPFIEVVDHDPNSPLSPLEFVKRFRSRSHPVLLRGFVAHWPAIRKWDWQYLLDAVGDQRVHVAITPDGRSDAVEPNTGLFLEPHTEEMTIRTFQRMLAHRQGQESAIVLDTLPEDHDGHTLCIYRAVPTVYIQYQNNNFEHEFDSLWCDIDETLHRFGREVFSSHGEGPDAFNLWIGDEQSITSMHQDWYENLYAVVRGTKRFTLIAPWECGAVPKILTPEGRYSVARPVAEPACSEWEFRIRRIPAQVATSDENPRDTSTTNQATTHEAHIPWIQRTPSDVKRTQDATVHVIDVGEGDVLYLPAMWYHQVEQIGDKDETGPSKNISVNVWFDMDFTSPLYAFQAYLKRQLGIM